MTIVRYRDEVLNPIVKLCAVMLCETLHTVGLPFVLMEDNVRPYRAATVDDFLESEATAFMEWPIYSRDFNPVKIFAIPFTVLCLDI